VALLHILLVLVPEGITNLPIGKKYWPEMIGGILFLILFSMVVSSQFRQQLNLKYHLWKLIHRILGYLVLAALLIHVCFVSESFKSGPLRHVLIMIVIAVLLWSAISKVMILFVNEKNTDN
jgi:DMSO/TMAO reductase YedYZ heme-binding membrane subunit